MSFNDPFKNVEFRKALLQALTKNTFDFSAVVKAGDRTIVYVNEMGAKLFEYEQSSDLIGILAPTLRKNIISREELDKHDKEIARNGFYETEAEYVTKNGKTFWGHLQLNLFTAENTDYLLLQIEKIDRAKKAEEKLKKEQQRFGALLDYASIGVLIVNEKQEIILMNIFALNLFGYSMDEVIGKNIDIFIPSRFHKIHHIHMQNYFANPMNQPVGDDVDLFAVNKNGDEFPVELSLGSYKADNEIFVMAFVRDITVRKKGEYEIRKLNADLEAKVKERTDELAVTISKLERQIKDTEEAEKVLMNVMQFQKAVLDSSGAMIITTDEKGIITLFNPAAEELLGYKADEIIGKYTPSVFHDADDVTQKNEQFSKELNKNFAPGFETFVVKSILNLENTHEWIYVKKDGTRFPVSLTITALRNEQNMITGFLGVSVDISEIKKTEDELKKALEREKELNELKSRFVSMASHEFRTPLSTVLSSIYLLQKYSNTLEQPKREKHIERIVSSVNMLTDILDDFLSVGKIEEGKVTARFSLFNFKDYIENIVAEIKPILKHEQQIIYHHSGIEEVWLDRSLLKHIVINLLSNAIKFSPENSTIKIKTKKSGTSLKLSVKDQGIGISKEDQQHLFERFFRGANVTTIQGTGLGLHIVQKYAELMNGKVEWKSELEKGSEFILTFVTDM